MQKIAVFGGTFNPIHNGHIHIAEQFAEILGVEKVLLIPANTPPHKAAPDLVPAADRLAMCRLAAKGAPLFEASDIEIRRGGQSYTYQTLMALKDDYPQAELFLIMGEDMFLTLQKWVRPKVIFSLATVCAAPRSQAGCEKLLRYAEKIRPEGAKTRIEDIRYLPISSSMVRRAVGRGESIGALVPPAVEDYIRQHYLYLE